MHIGNRSLNKTSGSSGSKKLVGGLAPQQAEVFLPSEIEQGIYRYTKIAGGVYSVYRITTKKYLGIALYNGNKFEPCGNVELIDALKHESKNRK